MCRCFVKNIVVFDLGISITHQTCGRKKITHFLLYTLASRFMHSSLYFENQLALSPVHINNCTKKVKDIFQVCLLADLDN